MDGAGSQGLNVGSPVAYYGMRMIDQILARGELPVTDTMILTAIIAPCASVTRPYQQNFASETVARDINPVILENDFKRLYEVTELFRLWFKAITGGIELKLHIHELQECTTVNFSYDTRFVFSYPDIGQMLSLVPQSVREETDMWWVVAPTGLPENETDFSQEFITGGMGTDDYSNAVFIADDSWFIQKPKHLGTGLYSEVERRTYLPQWFQHEYMHHFTGLIQT